MHTFKHLLTAFVLCMLLIGSGKTYAAFPVLRNTTAADSPVIQRGERIYQEQPEPAPRSSYQTPTDGHRKPYKNHEKEARLAYIFGFLGLYLYPFAIPALILGIIGADRRNKYYNKAVWGIVMGAIPIAVGIGFLIAWLLLL